MNLEEEYQLSFYRPIAMLDEEHGVELVQHSGNNKIFVRKTLLVYEESVFRYLKKNYIPGIPRIQEVVRDEDRLIVIEEYVHGQSLSERLKTEGTFTESETIGILKKLLKILKRLHTLDPPLIHRDIKPSNVILKDDQDVVLLDMNAARWHRSDTEQDTRLIGTFGFAAPEQYGFGQSGIETDIYSLGVLANVMLTGQFPQEKPAEGPLGEIIGICTKIDPEDRFRSDDALYTALEILENSRAETAAPYRKPSVRVENERDNVENEQDNVKTGQDNVKSSPSWHKYLFPGLLSQKTAVRIWSLIGYLMIFLVSAVQRIGSENRLIVWLNRIFCLLTFLLPVLFTTNYLDIQGKLRISRIPYRWLRILVIGLIDFVICMLLVFCLTGLEDLLQ